jgi:hypothetical protein
MADTAAPSDDDDLVAAPTRPLTRDRIKALVVKRYNTRVHMSLILVTCGLVSMSTSWTLLHLGVRSMLLRYPVAMALAYGTFLLGVWVWLRATGLLIAGRREGDPGNASKAKSGKGNWIGDLSTGGSSGSSGGGGGGGGASLPRGGGGAFDGGGASSSFAETHAPMAAMSMPQQPAADAAVPTRAASGSSSKSSVGSKGGGGLGLDIDGDGIVLIVLAVLLVLVVFISSGYLIWCAPDVLTEAAFGAALTGTLSRPAATHGAEGWVAGVVKKTWWPFALVMVAAIAFAGWSSANYPKASTFRQAIVLAIHNDHSE